MLTVVELRCEGWRLLGLPDVCDRQRSFYPKFRGKNVVHECKGEFEYGLSDGQVICMTISPFNYF